MKAQWIQVFQDSNSIEMHALLMPCGGWLGYIHRSKQSGIWTAAQLPKPDPKRKSIAIDLLRDGEHIGIYPAKKHAQDAVRDVAAGLVQPGRMP